MNDHEEAIPTTGSTPTDAHLAMNVAQPGDKPEVVRLARLLVKVAPLAELVNSDQFSETDRTRLRKLVGVGRFFDVAVILNQMTTRRRRSAARTRPVAEPACPAPSWNASEFRNVLERIAAAAADQSET